MLRHLGLRLYIGMDGPSNMGHQPHRQRSTRTRLLARLCLTFAAWVTIASLCSCQQVGLASPLTCETDSAGPGPELPQLGVLAEEAANDLRSLMAEAAAAVEKLAAGLEKHAAALDGLAVYKGGLQQLKSRDAGNLESGRSRPKV